MQLADCVLVVLVPGLGDDIKRQKAGLMESRIFCRSIRRIAGRGSGEHCTRCFR